MERDGAEVGAREQSVRLRRTSVAAELRAPARPDVNFRKICRPQLGLDLLYCPSLVPDPSTHKIRACAYNACACRKEGSGTELYPNAYGVPFVSKRFFSVNLRYSCHDSLSWRRFSFRGDDSLFAATTLFSRRRLSFRGDDSLFAATILFSRRRFSFRGDDCLFVATILFSRRRFSFRGD